MVNTIIGIDFAPESQKVVELEQPGKVLSWIAEYRANPTEDNPARNLALLLKKTALHGRQAVISISGPEIIYQLVDLPPLQEKEVLPALRFKLDAEGSILSFKKIPLPNKDEKNWYLVVLVPEKQLHDLLMVVKKSGLIPKEIVPSACALKHYCRAEEFGEHIIFFCGRYSSQIILVKEHQMLFSREVKLGVEDIVRSLVGAFVAESGRVEVDHDRAERLVLENGIPLNLAEYTAKSGLPAEGLMGMVRPVLERMGLEIDRTIDYYREKTLDETEFTKVCLVGEGSRVANLAEYFQGSVNKIFVAPAPAYPAVKPEFAELERDYARALGAASLKDAPLSLLPEKFRHPLQYWAGKLLNFWTLGVVFVLLLSLVYGFFFLQARTLDLKVQELKRQLTAQGVKLDQQLGLNPLVIKLKNELKVGSSNTDPFVVVMGRIHRLTPKDKLYFRELVYDRVSRSLILKGVVLQSFGGVGVTAFVKELEKDPLFEKVNLEYLQESDKFNLPTYEFEIKSLLRLGAEG